jgi:hypothetical protein
LDKESGPELGSVAGKALSDAAKLRFFEAGWREHPCGSDGAAMLAALAHAARAHGGRVDVKPAGRGCAVRFIVPRLDG